MAGLCVTAIGMGLVSTIFRTPIKLPEFWIVGCISIIWTGIALPFMRTVYAVAIGCVLAIPSWVLFLVWAFSTMRPR